MSGSNAGFRNSDGGLRRRDFLRLGGYGTAGALLLGSTGCSVLSGGSTSAAASSGLIAAAYPRPFDDLDPHGSSAAAEQTLLVAEQVFDTLVAREDGRIVPRLAMEWANPEPNVWRFILRPGVRFHDGNSLTAEDVAASILRQANADDSPLADLWESLEDVEASDDRTVILRSQQPIGTVLSNVTLLPILPARQMNKPGFFRRPVGSGPYQVLEFVPGSQLLLSRNGDYWAGKPASPRLALRTISEDATRMTSIETGEVQLTWPVPADQLARLKGNADVEIRDVPSYQYWFNWFNCSREPFTNPDVRRAMWHAVDADAIAKNLFPGTAKVASAPIPSTVFGYEAQEPYEFNPAKAKSLLAQAGLADGFTTSVMWNPTQAPGIREVAETMISYWADIGVRVQPQELEEALWLERLIALDWDMDLQTNVTATGDADYSLARLYHSSANRLGYQNRELDEILMAARQSRDNDERERLYAQACRIIWDDAAGIFPLEMRLNFAVRGNVSGFEPSNDESPRLAHVRA